MTIKAKVYQHQVTIPMELDVPDGTEVEIHLSPHGAEHEHGLPTFRGNGLMPGVDLNDTSALEEMMDLEDWKRKHG